jgi:1,4-dihydroxy-2-naphthoate octaprenyltransferase
MSPSKRAPRPWRIWLAAARPRTFPAAVAPVVVGSAMAARDGRFDAGAAGLCLLFAVLVQVGANFANDYCDHVRGADTAARRGPARAVASGLVAPSAMRLATLVVLSSAFVVGLGLLSRGGPWMLAVGAACIVSAVAYTGGPYPLGYHGLGDIFVFVFFGLIAVSATYFVQAGRLTGDAVLAGVPIGLLAANILVVNNYRDLESDAAAGKRTLVVRFGRGAAKAQFILCAAAAFAVPLVYLVRGRNPWCLLPLLAAPLAWRHARRLRADAGTEKLIDLLGATGRLLAYFAALFAAGIIL